MSKRFRERFLCIALVVLILGATTPLSPLAAAASSRNDYSLTAYEDGTFSPTVTYTSSNLPANGQLSGMRILVDFSSASENIGKKLTVASSVQSIKFTGRTGYTFTGLNIVVQGNTDVVFDNFRYIGGTTASALELTGTDATVITMGAALNSVGGRGNYPAINVTGNLLICGNASFTVNHAANTAAGSNGMDAIKVAKTLNIDVYGGAKLVATGGTGTAGSNGSDGSGTAANRNGNPGSPGGVGGSGGNGIVADTINILNASVVELNGGNGTSGGNGGNGGNGSDGGSGSNGSGTGNGGGGSAGGDGGSGGVGGSGGKGGSPLVVGNSSDNIITIKQKLSQSPFCSLSLTVGSGGSGGKGGNGAAGGNGGSGGNGGGGILGTAGGSGGKGGAGGYGGYGGNGGAGGYNGSLEIVGGNPQNYGSSSASNTGGAGGSGGYGGSGGSGGKHGPGFIGLGGGGYADNGSNRTSDRRDSGNANTATPVRPTNILMSWQNSKTAISRVNLKSYTTLELNIPDKKSETLIATTTPENTDPNVIWRWSSSNPSIVSVDSNGVITAYSTGGGATGSARITAEMGGNSAYCDVTVFVTVTDVKIAPAASEILLKEAYYTPGTSVLEPGSVQLSKIIEPQNASNLAVNWTSSNPGVASVTNDGFVRAVSPGTANITVRTADGGYQATHTITVKPIPMKSIKLSYSNPTLPIRLGQTFDLGSYLVIDPINTTNTKVTWSSADSSIAKVDSNGKISAIKPGWTTITVKSADGGFTAKCDVNIVQDDVSVTAVTISKTGLSTTAGQSEILTASVTPVNATNQTIIWSSSNPSVASAAGGVITAFTSGTTVIKAVSLDGGFSAECTVSVAAPVAGTPAAVPSGNSGFVLSGTNIMLNSSSFGASIYYTTDGSEPNEYSNIYTSPISLNESAVIKAKAYKAGYVPSATASFLYNIKARKPVSDPADGAVVVGTKVTLVSETYGAEIRYTLNNSAPTAASTKFSEPIVITKPTTIKAIAIKDGIETSDAATLVFDVKLFKPTADPPTNYTLGSGDIVKLSCETEGAEIRYTTDGSVPNANSKKYDNPIKVSNDVTIKAAAFKSGWATSDVESFKYIVAPRTSSPTANYTETNIFAGGRVVNLSAENGATIFYTTDGSTPTVKSRIYTQPIVVTSTNDVFVVKAVAHKSGMAGSLVSTFEYGKASKPLKVTLGFGTIGIRLPDSVPLVGGKDLELDLDKFPCDVIYEDGKIMISIGHEIEAKGSYPKLKDKINAVKDLKKTIDFGAIRGQMNKKYPMGAFLGNIKPEFEVMGYLEGVLPMNGKSFSLSGGLLLKFGVKSKTEYQLWIGVVPAVITLDVGLSAELTGKIGIIQPENEDEKIQPEAALDFVIPHIEVRGGVGIAYVASIGAYGSADMNLNWNIMNATTRWRLDGAWGAYAAVLGFEYKIPAMSGTLWDSGHRAVAASAAMRFDAEVYTVAQRDYLDDQSGWLGDSMVRAASFGVSNNLKVLQKSVYSQTSPLIAEANGQRVMLFLSDNGSKSALNRTTLMYSLYHTPTDTWGVPRPVLDDGSADFYPSIADDGKTIWVTWHKSKEVFPEGATMDDLIAGSEIAVARFDGSAFSDVSVLTDNSVLDTQPKIAVNGREAFTVWVQNENNDIFGTDGKNNKIMMSQLTDGEWSEPVELAKRVSTVLDMDAGFLDGDARVAYITDSDNALDTTEDRNLILKNMSGNTVAKLAEEKLVSNPHFTHVNGAQALCWYDEGDIRYMTSNGKVTRMFNEPVMPTDNFRIISDSDGNSAVIYPYVNNETGAGHFAARLYNSGKWSNSFVLAETNDFARYFNGVWENNGEFNIVFNNSGMDVIGSELIEVNNLCALRAAPSADINLSGLYYQDEDVRTGQNLPVSAAVENIGGVEVDGIIIEVNGKNAGIFPIDKGLQTGEATIVDFEIPIPDNMQSKTEFAITVKPTGLTDVKPDDNNHSVTLGYSYLLMNLTKSDNEDSTVTVTATVENLASYSTNAKLLVHRGTADGEIIDYAELGEIDGNASSSVQFVLDPEMLVPNNEECVPIYYELISDGDELGQKSDFIVLFSPTAEYTPEFSGIDYSSNELLVYGEADSIENRDFAIDLTGESLIVPSGYNTQSFSKDGGKRWQNVTSSNISPKNFTNFFNKNLDLVIADKPVDRKARRPAEGAAIVKFPRINKRPASPKVAVNYLIGADTTGQTLGDWVLVPRGSKADTSKPLKDGIEIGAADLGAKTVNVLGYGKFFDGDTVGIPVKSPSGTRAEKSSYYVRYAPISKDGVYTAASKTTRVHAVSGAKANARGTLGRHTYKIDYKKESVKLRRGDLYSIGGAEFETVTGKTYFLDVTDGVTRGDDIRIRRGATAKAPSSEEIVINPLPRLMMDDVVLVCANGTIKSSMKNYEAFSKNKWGSVPKVKNDGTHTFDLRMKPSVKSAGRDRPVSGYAASEPGKLVIICGERAEIKGKTKSGVLTAGIFSTEQRWDESRDLFEAAAASLMQVD